MPGLGMGATRSSALLRAVIAAFRTIGIDTDVLLARVGLDVRRLQALPEYVSIELSNQIWEEAVRLVGDPRLGLAVATLLHCDMYVTAGLVRHSATLGDAIVRLTRFGRLLGAGFDMRLDVQGEQAILQEPHYPGPLLHVQGIVCQLVSIGLDGRRLTGNPKLKSIEYRLMPPRPPFAAALEELVGSPMRFGATHNAIVFPSHYLHAAIQTGDPARVAVCERHAQALLERLRMKSAFASNVEGMLAIGLAGDTAETIAAKLGVTTRTLARRLSAEGTSFQELRDDVRRRLAEGYLRHTCMSTTDIALCLGFSDATAFSRAFRRWTGAAPTGYRASVQALLPQGRPRT